MFLTLLRGKEEGQRGLKHRPKNQKSVILPGRLFFWGNLGSRAQDSSFGPLGQSGRSPARLARAVNDDDDSRRTDQQLGGTPARARRQSQELLTVKESSS